MINKSFSFTALVFCASLLLAGCESVNNTMSDMRQNMSDWRLPSLDFFQGDDDDEMVVAEAETVIDCPEVVAVDDLRFHHDYMEGNDLQPVNKISSIVISRLDSACHVKDETLIVDLEIGFSGTLGPEAKKWNTRQVSFAYPYFLAIGTPDDTIMAKEIFPLTLTYEQGETEILHVENIRQVIPLREPYTEDNYKFLVGFQLSDEELRYNQKLLRRETVTKTPGYTPAAAIDTKEGALSKAALETPPLPLEKPPYKTNDEESTGVVKASPPAYVESPRTLPETKDSDTGTIQEQAPASEAARMEAREMPPKTGTAGSPELEPDEGVTYVAPPESVGLENTGSTPANADATEPALAEDTFENRVAEKDEVVKDDTVTEDDSNIPPLDFYEYPETDSPQPPAMPE